MFSNRYIFIYSVIMVIVVAVVLSIAAQVLKPAQERNIRVEKMQNILSSVKIETTPANAIPVFEKHIRQILVVDHSGNEISGVRGFEIDMAMELKKPVEKQQFPVFIANLEDGSKCFVFAVRGKGLWGPIWGYVSLKDDFNTIYGVVFDHKGETPGLGAEINTDWFEDPWTGKQIFDEGGRFVSVGVIKGGVPGDDLHNVDAISGGTITSKGLEQMVKDGISAYLPYIKNKVKI